MKQIIYIIFGKTLGKFWVFAAIPFRAYARSVVYNYVLQNDLPLKRLRERFPVWLGTALQGGGLRGRWALRDVHGLAAHHLTEGHIEYRRVTKLRFYAVVFLIWGWLDDDSNQDTTDTGYIKTLLSGQRKSWHRIFNPALRKIDLDGAVYGNSFDLGDVRGQHPFFNWAAAFVWNERNTAMNFQYLFFNY